MNTSDRITEFVFSDYVELTKKECLKWIVMIIFLDCLFLFLYGNTIYKLLTLVSSGLIVLYLLFLIISNKQRKRPQNKFLCDGIALAYFALQFNFVAYRLFCGGKNVVLLICLFALLLICGFTFVLITKKKLFLESVSYFEKKKSTNYALAAALMGYIISRMFFPFLDYELVMKIGAVCFLIGSLLLSSCSIHFIKVMYVYRYNLSNSSRN